LIRVGIIAETAAQGRALADLLSDDDRFQVVSLSPFALTHRENEMSYIDAIVLTSLASLRMVSADGPPVIVVGRETGEEGDFRDPIRGWLPPAPTGGELSAAIIAVAQSFVVLTTRQAKRLLGRSAQKQIDDTIGEALTPREFEVLRMLADGLGNKEIANRLGISEHTSKFHVAQILAKLGAASRTEAVAIGMRRGLVPV
jgi:DNA-binding CsgD family transcriptional regulator